MRGWNSDLLILFAAKITFSSFTCEERGSSITDLIPLITPPSGRGLVIPIFFPWGFFFFGGHLPQTSGFRSAKEILVVSFAAQPRAFTLSDRNIFPPPGGRTTTGSNAPGAFLVFFSVVTCPRPSLGQNNTCR